MFVTSIKSPATCSIRWCSGATEFYFGNYTKAYRVLDYSNTLMASILISVVPLCSRPSSPRWWVMDWRAIAFGQASCSFVPPCHLHHPAPKHCHPANADISRSGLLGNRSRSFSRPAGQGYRSAIFILIFYQGFLSFPKCWRNPRGWMGLRISASSSPSPYPPRCGLHRLVHFFRRLVLERNFLTVIFLEGGTTTCPCSSRNLFRLMKTSIHRARSTFSTG